MVNEAQLSQQIVDLARYLGWMVYRTWCSKHSPAGFPDLCMFRGNRLVFAELKSDAGRLTLEQCLWLIGLHETSHCEVYLWRPSDWNTIVACLEREEN